MAEAIDPFDDLSRTLVAAGFEIEGFSRHGAHSELRCCRETLLGAEARILLALSHSDAFSNDHLEDLRHTAETQGRSLVCVAGVRADGVLSYSDLFDAAGGAVPSWRALASTYAEALSTASRNKIPNGETGEAWLIFERLVSDGLEFCFGRRTRHLGGTRRGSAVPDVIAQLPDGRLLVVDAKATSNEFDASTANLRALGEYLILVRNRQTGGYGVVGAVVIAPQFAQDPARLREVALEFGAKYGGSVAFLSAADLSAAVQSLSARPVIRNSVRWPHLFRGGPFSMSEFEEEMAAISAQRVGEE